jgi:hypothetical protein
MGSQQPLAEDLVLETSGADWAVFGEDKRYRYALSRDLGEGCTVLFVMLNPSTATAFADDPTIRKCKSFAKAAGAGELLVGNLFGLRTPDPNQLMGAEDPVGEHNDHVLKNLLLEKADTVVVAWGNKGDYMNRSQKILPWIQNPLALTVNKSGEPGHPLYLAKDTQLSPYD